MTTEQYILLAQYASDFRSAVLAYEDEYSPIDLISDPISDIVATGANLMHLVDTLVPSNDHKADDQF